MGKSKKKKSLRNPNAISSDSAIVNRLLREMDERREYEAWEVRQSSGRYHNVAAHNNAGHPYNGGLPGLGKRR